MGCSWRESKGTSPRGSAHSLHRIRQMWDCRASICANFLLQPLNARLWNAMLRFLAAHCSETQGDHHKDTAAPGAELLFSLNWVERRKGKRS